MPLLQRALAIREKAPDPGQAEVAVSAQLLAKAYYAQGRVDEAQELHRRAMVIRERAGFTR